MRRLVTFLIALSLSGCGGGSDDSSGQATGGSASGVGGTSGASSSGGTASGVAASGGSFAGGGSSGAGASGGGSTGGGASGGGSSGGGASGGGASGGGSSGAGADAGDAIAQPTVTDITAESLTFDNARGETIRARLFAPVVDGPLPGVVVLHGSGGLFRQLSAGETTTNDPCSDEMEPQFVEWADILPREGYVTIMPASFASRGFCDYNTDPHPGFDDPTRLAARTFDLFAALDTLCADGRVLCDRLGVLGFSNGGSVTVLGLHEALDAVTELAGLPADRPTPRVGVAYYPGCGLQGFITLSEDPTRVDEYYMPLSPVWVHHAALDSLLDNCQLRDRQVTAVSQARAVTDPFDLRVFAGADHGFDSTPDNAAEEDAKATARELTLEHLRIALFGG